VEVDALAGFAEGERVGYFVEEDEQVGVRGSAALFGLPDRPGP
jgi:hypothetical protein